MKALPRYQHLRLITAEQHAYGDPSDIATAAYYKAERRGFAPGHELDDWLEAETGLSARLKAGEACKVVGQCL